MEAYRHELGFAQAQMKDRTEGEKSAIEARLKEMQISVQAASDRRDAAVQQHIEAQRQQTNMQIAEMKASVELIKAGQQQATSLLQQQREPAKPDQRDARTQAQVADLSRALEEMRERMSRPLPITRDAKGKPTAVGDRKVRYGRDGLIESVG
jgi:hypothetical protein